jgi:hypothetical protein
MRQHGRKSASSLSVIASMEIPRPAPPRSMAPAAKKLWRSITAQFAPEFFCGGEILLEGYCEMAVMLRDVIGLIKEEQAREPVNYKRLAMLVALQRSEALAVARLAANLRLSPRSRFDRYSVRPTPKLPDPWDLGSPSRGEGDDAKPADTGSPFPRWPPPAA